MKNFFAIIFTCLIFSSTNITGQNITLPPASPKASVSEQIGLSNITIEYSRPGVKGREGKIWGKLVPYNNGKPFPWRAGANNNTTISFSDDVKIEGKALAAGTYGLHIIPSETEWIFIFSTNSTSWGSFSYDEKEDALRVTVPVTNSEFVEWMRFQFLPISQSETKVELAWERKKAAFTVEFDLHEIVLENIRKELRNVPGFRWQSWNTAANYCLKNNINLEEALTWAERSIAGGFGAKPTFANHLTKARLLEKLNRPIDARATMDAALALGDMGDLHNYGRQLIDEGRAQDAMKIFELNRQKHPNDNFTTLVGLARGYKALGDKAQAINYFEMAARNAPKGQAKSLMNEAAALRKQ